MLQDSFNFNDPLYFNSSKHLNKVLKLAGKKVKGKERTIQNLIVRSFPLTFLPFEATTTSKLLEL